jgi:hypothetical protein
MATLNLRTRITEKLGVTISTFGHKILYIVAGSYSAFKLSYDEPGGGSYVKDYENQLAAWKTLSLAIQGTKGLRFAMPRDFETEQYYLKHTELSNAISQVEILAYRASPNQTWWESSPEQGIGIFDVTVVPGVLTIQGVTTVGLQYSGATKEWF